MGLRHAVVTSVDRDDLPDYGASAFVGVIRSIRMMAPECKVEVLTPDFRGQEMPLAKVVHERPDVFNHNVETVPRLYPRARRGSDFLRSCRVLRTGEGDGRRAGGDQVRADGRARRGVRRDGRDVPRSCASTRSRSSPSASTCARPRITCRWSATGTPTSSTALRDAALRARLRVGRRRPARAQLVPRRRGGGRGRRARGRRVAMLEGERVRGRAVRLQMVEPLAAPPRPSGAWPAGDPPEAHVAPRSGSSTRGGGASPRDGGPSRRSPRGPRSTPRPTC